MQTPFDLAQTIFQNARNFSVQYHTISDFPPADELIRETGRWFSELEIEDDDYFRSIRVKIWRLRVSVIYSLLPFDSRELGLAEQLLSLQREVVYIPSLQERIDRLSKIVNFLLETPCNPKRVKLFELLRLCPNKGFGIGLVMTLVRGSNPGWSKTVVDEIFNIAPECDLIQSPKAFKLRTYRQMILPASGRLSPVIFDLYHGCRAEKLDVVMYKREGVYTPLKRALPKGTYVKRRLLNFLVTSEVSEKESSETYLDEWAQRRFWESLRQHFPSGSSSAFHDREFFIKARIVILADNRKVCLREDMHIIEISELVEGQNIFETTSKRYPRKCVDQLKQGDLIVLRTSGSGEYLVDFANAMMEADGNKNLRTTALDWKPLLRQALQVHGSEKIAQLLTAKGHNIGSHGYIWMWTTDQVIRPQSQSLFLDLMNIVSSLGFCLEEGDPFAAATMRWKKMKEIIRYHVTAGQKIRLTLLERLRKMIKDRVVITDSYHLSLPGLSAGEISVFRVAAVDSVSIDIPYYHAGVITPLEN
jgi:hypothetical protein